MGNVSLVNFGRRPVSKPKTFRFRAFVSLLTAFSFIAIAITGIVLYITPPGRVANWTNWTFWGLSKEQWSALHICTSTLFLIVSLLHIWLNIKPLINYFINKAKDASSLRFEWIAALVVCGVVIGGSLKPFWPFRSLLDLNERIKLSWGQPQQAAPIPHAELLTIAELAEQANIDVETILERLQNHNIEAIETDVFGDIAELQNMSPNELYGLAITVPKPEGGRGAGQGSGLGQKTLDQVCGEMGIEPGNAVDALREAGIEATGEMRIREIADQYNMHPTQIRQILENL